MKNRIDVWLATQSGVRRFSAWDVLAGIFGAQRVVKSRNVQVAARRVGGHLRRLGWRSTTQRIGDIVVHGWVRA